MLSADPLASIPLLSPSCFLQQRGQVIIQQGERGDHFYVAEKGVLDVMVASAPLPLDASLDDEQLEQLELQQQQQQPSQPPGHRRQPSGASDSATAATRKSSLGSLGSVLLDNDLMADIAANAADEAVFAAYAAEDQQQQQPAAAAGSSAEQLGPTLAKTSISSSVSQQLGGLLGGLQTEWGELVHTYVAPPVVGGVYPSFGELALLYGECGFVCGCVWWWWWWGVWWWGGGRVKGVWHAKGA